MLFQQAEDTLTVFQPQMNDLWTGLLASVVLLVAFSIGGYLLYRSPKKDPRLRVVLPMLCYMVVLLALMSIGGHWLTTLKYPELGIGPEQITVDGESMRRPRPDDLRLQTINSSYTGETGQILLMQLPSGKTLALPGDRYPVKEIMRLLR